MGEAAAHPDEVTMEVRAQGIAVITISNNPPVNALNLKALEQLKVKYIEAMKRDDVKAVILTGGGGKFSSGLDITLMQHVQTTGDNSFLAEISRDLINLVEDGRKPSLAAIQGYALGGGLELAMGCCARVATPGAKLGLPELTLGVIPGMGGTQRLPRLVGVSRAVEMLMTSRPITSGEGKTLGLIDVIASPEELLEISCNLTLDIVENRKPRLHSLTRTDKLGSSTQQTKEILQGFRQQTKETDLSMPHKLACLDEEKVFKELILSTAAKALVHVFCAQRETSSVRGVTDAGLKPQPIEKVGVIGAGFMGSGITTSLILSNIHVALKDLNSEYLQKGIEKIEANLQGLVVKGKLHEKGVKKALSFLSGVSDYSEFKDVDLVIEAAIEDLSLKQSIFEEIEKVCPPHCILASSTSGIDLNEIGEKTGSQDRIVGAHFFRLHDVTGYGLAIAFAKEMAAAFPDRTFQSPLHALMLQNGRQGKSNGKGYYIFEKGSKPKPDYTVLPIIEESRRISNLIDKEKVISVSDQEIVEIIFFPVVNEECRVMEEGVIGQASELDVASILGMNFPSRLGGVIFWADTIGAKYIYTNLSKWAALYGPFFRPSELLEERAMKGIPLGASVEA